MEPRGIAFDLDGTLTPAKSQMEASMVSVFANLVERLPVAITSGASLSQIKWQVLDLLPAGHLNNIYVFPTGGAAMFVYDDSVWTPIYQHEMSEASANQITEIIEECVNASGLCEDTQIWGPRVEWRGSQVTFSGLGQKAPYDAKIVWDKDKQKRLKLREMMMPRLPDYDVVLGGTTSIDIIPKGINKAYAMKKFAEHIGVNIKDVLYIGDDLNEGGNDHIVMSDTEAVTHLVTSPSDTQRLISDLMETGHYEKPS